MILNQRQYLGINMLSFVIFLNNLCFLLHKYKLLHFLHLITNIVMYSPTIGTTFDIGFITSIYYVPKQNINLIFNLAVGYDKHHGCKLEIAPVQYVNIKNITLPLFMNW